MKKSFQVELTGSVKMVNVKKFVEGKYLSAKNVGDNRGKTVTIDAAFQDVINEEEKIVLRLSGIEKPMPLNHTNISILFAEYGENTDMWINQKVTIGIVKVKYQGELVDSIQLSPVK